MNTLAVKTTSLLTLDELSRFSATFVTANAITGEKVKILTIEREQWERFGRPSEFSMVLTPGSAEYDAIR